ncbi:MAG: hypothetical protein R3321_10980, partial [Nitrososphaeraceae archaeon]|nr:hypothetical protein [Nitrososphaeraceae archaeon]
PVIILITVLLVEKTTVQKLKKYIAVFGSVCVFIINAGYDHDYDTRTFYNSRMISTTYYKVKEEGTPPGIEYIGVNVDKNNQVVITLNRNDSLARGISPLICYEPIFGYGLENFPINSLQPGSVFEQNEGRLNIKKPSCYIYGLLNQCEPGDHFLVSEKNQVEAFVNYRPVFFDMPLKLIIANWINKLALVTIVIMFFIYAGRRIIYAAK